MNKTYLALSLFLVCTPTFASDDWFLMGNTKESKYYINMPSISETREYGKTIVKSWIKIQIFNDLTKDGLSVGDYTLMLYQVNCNENTIGVKTSTSYKDGKPYGSQINKTYVQMNDVIPESIGQSILAYSCEGNSIKKENANKTQKIVDAYRDQNKYE